jgi:hypothetical protein
MEHVAEYMAQHDDEGRFREYILWLKQRRNVDRLEIHVDPPTHLYWSPHTPLKALLWVYARRIVRGRVVWDTKKKRNVVQKKDIAVTELDAASVSESEETGDSSSDGGSSRYAMNTGAEGLQATLQVTSTRFVGCQCAGHRMDLSAVWVVTL